LDLGFTLKNKETSLEQVTFLKGWWRRRYDGDLVWLPLPSACVKIGKILRDPAHIYKQEPYEKMAAALAMSYGHVPPDYPVLGPFLHQMRQLNLGLSGELAQRGTTQVETFTIASKRVMCDHKLSRVEALSAFCFRYRVEYEDILRVEHLIRTHLTAVPIYLEDPIFLALAETDYG
jgi:hypothetical protein